MPVRVPRRESAVRLWAAIAIIAIGTSPSSSSARAGDGPRGAEWAAKDAVIYLEATHPEALLDRVLDPKFQGYLGSIPQFARFVKGDGYRQQKAGVEFVANLLETTWEKGLRGLAGGGVVFVAEVDTEQGKGPWGFLAITPSDPSFLVKSHAKLLGLARGDAKGKGQPDPITETTHRGVTLYSASKDETHAIVRDTLVVSRTADSVKTVIDRALAESGSGSPTIAADTDWKARRDRVTRDTMVWGFVRLDRLREIDPKKFQLPETTDANQMFLFGPWLEAVRKAPWVAANLSWNDAHLTMDVALPTPPGGYSAALKRYLPPEGQGAPAPLKPKGVIAGLGLWRDVSSIWEARNDLFTPQVVQGLAQLDTFAGQYFGGRDFGSGVLGAVGNRWRFVVAEQDYTQIEPVPDLKLPGFALVIDLKPDDDDFAQRLKVAFQSFVGLANLGTSQTKAPPLELGSEKVEGVTIATTKFMVPKVVGNPKEPVHQRQNYSPSVAQVGDHFILSSSLGLTKDLIVALKRPETTVDSTLLVEADGPMLAKLLDANRARLVTQNMMEKGNDRATASGEIDLLLGLLRYAGKGALTARDRDKALEFRLDFALGAK